MTTDSNICKRGIDERTLLYFLETYQAGSIRAASNRLRIAPSAISRRLVNLEADLGARLFERLSRGLRPTPVADALARYARERRHLTELLDVELESLRGGQRGVVRFAAGEGYLSELVDGALSQFHRSHPSVVVHLAAGSTDEVVSGLLEDRIDVGLVYNPPPHQAIEVVELLPAPLYVIVPPGHALARSARIELEDLQPYAVGLLDPRHGVRRLFDAACSMAGIRPSIRFECNSIAALRRFVSSGSGIAVLPRFAAEPELAEGRVVAVRLKSRKIMDGKSGLMVKRDRQPTPATRDLLHTIRQALALLNSP